MQWMEEGGVVRYSAVDGGRRGCEIQCSGWREEGL